MNEAIMRLVKRLAVPLAVIVSLVCPLHAYADAPTMSEQDLQTTITTATEGATVTLTGDVTLSKSLDVNKSITLDLDGHIIRYESKLAAGKFDPALKLSADGVQVTNGSIDSNNVGVYVEGGGQTVLSDCVIAASGEKEALELSRSMSDGDALAIIENVEINAGTGGIAISKDYQDAGNGIRFTGNTHVSGRVKCVFNGSNGNAIVSVEGGTYNSGAAQCFYNGNTSAGDAELAKHLRIVGGQFTTRPLDAFVDPGSTCVEGSAEYPFFVAPSGQTGEAYLETADGSRMFYDTVELAVAAAQGSPVYMARSAQIDDVASVKGAHLVGATGVKLSVSAPLAQFVSQVASFENLTVACNDASLSAASGAAGALTAGTFGDGPTDALLSLVGEGYLVADDAAVQEPNKIRPQSAFEARIGRIGYALLTNAVTDSTAGDAKNQVTEQIDLLRDVTSQAEALGIFLPKSAFVLNLNGKSLTSGPSSSAVLLSAISGSAKGPDGARITIKNGTLNGGSFGVATNGTLKDVVLKLENVDVRADEQSGVAVYLAASGSTTITGGSYRAALGIQLCAGDLLVDGASVSALGQPGQKSEGDGPIMDGAAISVVDRDGYGAIGTVEIVGGKFDAVAGVPAIKAYHFDNTDKREEPWADAGKVIEVSGGTFSAVPENMDELCASGVGMVTFPDGTLALHRHQIEHVDAGDSTCAKRGHIEHWWCSVEGCGKLYADAAGTRELTHEEVLKPLAAHMLDHIVQQDPTAMEDGWLEHWKCSVCGALFLDGDGKKPVEFDELRVPATGEPDALEHNVTFVFGNGNELVVKVADGQTVGRPDDPSYEGWVFTGWYATRNADGTVADPYDFSTPVTDDMTLYGGWIKRAASTGPQGTGVLGDAVASPLPQTGDDSLLPIVVVGAIGVIAVVLGIVIARKRK